MESTCPAPVPALRTLGELSVGGAVQRPKPLLLLAYLSLEGRQSRARLARLFWPESRNALNSLAQHLIRLRPLGAVLREGPGWLEATVTTDAHLFRDRLTAGDARGALDVYGGEFLCGLDVLLGAELEDWLLVTREALAGGARAAHLTLAEAARDGGRSAEVARHAEAAFTLPGAAPLEEPELRRLLTLLPLHSPLRGAATREWREVRGPLLLAPRPPQDPPARPEAPIVGLDDLIARVLDSLEARKVVFISGEAGSGKSAVWAALRPHLGGVPCTSSVALPGDAAVPLSTYQRTVDDLLRDLRSRSCAGLPAAVEARLRTLSAQPVTPDAFAAVVALLAEVFPRGGVGWTDDFHHWDAASHAFAVHLTQRAWLEGSRHSVLVAYRPDELGEPYRARNAALVDAGAAVEFRLPPLGRAACEALAQHFLPGVRDAQLDALHRFSGGHPGVLRAVLEDARARGALPEALLVPPGPTRDGLARRIGAVRGAALDVLRVLALGVPPGQLSVPWLAALLGRPERAVLDAVDALTQGGWLTRAGLPSGALAQVLLDGLPDLTGAHLRARIAALPAHGSAVTLH